MSESKLLEQQKLDLLYQKSLLLMELETPSNAKFLKLGKIEHQLHLIVKKINSLVENVIDDKKELDFGCNGCKHFDNCGLRMDYGSDVPCDEKEV